MVGLQGTWSRTGRGARRGPPGQVIHGVGQPPQCGRPIAWDTGGAGHSHAELAGGVPGAGGAWRSSPSGRVDDDRPPPSTYRKVATGGEGCRRRLNRATVVPALDNEPHGDAQGVPLNAGAGHQGAVDLPVPCRAQACSGSGSRADVTFPLHAGSTARPGHAVDDERPSAAVGRATRAQGDLGLPRLLSAHPVAGGPHGWPCSTWNIGGRFRA